MQIMFCPVCRGRSLPPPLGCSQKLPPPLEPTTEPTWPLFPAQSLSPAGLIDFSQGRTTLDLGSFDTSPWSWCGFALIFGRSCQKLPI